MCKAAPREKRRLPPRRRGKNGITQSITETERVCRVHVAAAWKWVRDVATKGRCGYKCIWQRCKSAKGTYGLTLQLQVFFYLDLLSNSSLSLSFIFACVFLLLVAPSLFSLFSLLLYVGVVFLFIPFVFFHSHPYSFLVVSVFHFLIPSSCFPFYVICLHLIITAISFINEKETSYKL